MLTLTVEKRDTKANLNANRKAGKIPAIFYGRKEKSTPIWVPEKDFLKVLKKAGETSVIELKSGEHELQALIHEIDADPVTDVIRHADFYVIEKDKKLELSIPIHFIGISPAVKDLGGILVKVLHEIKIEALPKDLPQSFEVDISSLATFESQILAKDIKLPAHVELKINSDDVVAAVDQPREEKEEEVAPIDLASIEVEKKGKDEVAEGAEGSTTGDTSKPATQAAKEPGKK